MGNSHHDASSFQKNIHNICSALLLVFPHKNSVYSRMQVKISEVGASDELVQYVYAAACNRYFAFIFFRSPFILHPVLTGQIL